MTTASAEEMAQLEADATAALAGAVATSRSSRNASGWPFRSKRSRFAEMYQKLGSSRPRSAVWSGGS